VKKFRHGRTIQASGCRHGFSWCACDPLCALLVEFMGANSTLTHLRAGYLFVKPGVIYSTKKVIHHVEPYDKRVISLEIWGEP
jgi:hypothetical protein